MSIRWMNRVWDHSKQGGNALLLMIALADQANDQGICWPSIGTLARKTRLSERTVQALIHGAPERPGVPARLGLIETGELEVLEGGGRGRASTYRLTVRDTHPSEQETGSDNHTNGAVHTPIQIGDGAAERVQHADEKGAVCAERVQKNAKRVKHAAPQPLRTVNVTGKNHHAAATRARAQGEPGFASGEQKTIDNVGTILTPIGLDADPRFWRKVLDAYGATDLEAEALKMADWQRHHRKRQCSQRFVLNWLGRSGKEKPAGEVTRSGVARNEDQRFAVFRKYG